MLAETLQPCCLLELGRVGHGTDNERRLARQHPVRRLADTAPRAWGVQPCIVPKRADGDRRWSSICDRRVLSDISNAQWHTNVVSHHLTGYETT